jgi:hypothetical protein
MQDFFDHFRTSVSAPRLASYRAAPPAESSSLDVVILYLENIKRAQQVMPGLHLLEVTLRNQMHNALTTALGSSDWYDAPYLLKKQQLDQLAKARSKIQAAGKSETPDYIVAEITLGFWVGLFANPYEQLHRQNPTILKNVFPRVPRHFRTRSGMSALLGPLRDLRNRVSHWERVTNGSLLNQRTADIKKIIGWMNPAILLLLERLELEEAAIQQASMRYVAGGCFEFEQITAER